ncbi:MAG: outer membrane lipoprotein-sorting protein [Candidatus Hydrogenedens sp.]|nr:outer membrane lipoprotein-sorting protein [Candidatus Hydrogenedentota bacterium]NLF58395.1 outer membrane lipoprotein-sorting protein [Candidatus Hydrogenedens sp.]
MKNKSWPSRPTPNPALLLLALAALLAAPGALFAETPEELGLKIAQEASNRDKGYGDTSSELFMVLRNRNENETRLELRIKTLEMPGDALRALVVFDTPKDVRGTALLTYAYADKDDEQWLYLPSVARVKRIAGGNQSGPFMGSEFAFEDMGSQRVEKYTYKHLRDEALDGQDCFVIERYPLNTKSGYSKQVAWLDKEAYRIHKVDYYDRKDALLKTLTLTDYKQYLDKHWRPGKMEMINHQNGKSTLLEWKNYQFRAGLTERDFDQNSLKNVR